MAQITANPDRAPSPAIVKAGIADAGKIVFSPLLGAASGKKALAVMTELNTSPKGLTQTEAERRLTIHGRNEVAQEKQHGWPRRLLRTTYNPLVILLTALAVVSAVTGDLRAATVVALMVALGIVLRFVQESRADTAAAKLKAMITVTAAVLRDGEAKELDV